MHNVVADTYVESITLNINSASPIPSQQEPTSQSWVVLGAGAMGVATLSGGVGYVVSVDVLPVPEYQRNSWFSLD